METTINAMTTLNKMRKQQNPFRMIIEDFITDDLFSSLKNSGSALTTPNNNSNWGTNWNWSPVNYNPVNVRETETSYTIELSVPGFSKEDLEITLDGGKLTVTGSHDKHETLTTKSYEGYSRKEFYFSNFTRSFNLPETANSESISAKCENGVLTLEIAKTDSSVTKSKSIKIK